MDVFALLENENADLWKRNNDLAEGLEESIKEREQLRRALIDQGEINIRISERLRPGAASGTVIPGTVVAENQTQRTIIETCGAICDMLITKNKSYGNSALEPLRLFSKASPREQILVRLDDKLSRLSRGSEFPGDDTIKDLIGHLILLLVQNDHPSNITDVEPERETLIYDLQEAAA